jgi:hypothetical protein
MRSYAGRTSPFQVRVPLQPIVVILQQALALAHRQSALLARGFDVKPHRTLQVGDVILHVLQHFFDGVALDDFVDFPLAVLVDGNVHRVRVAQQVVQVAQNLLVRAEQKNAQVVRFTTFSLARQVTQRVQLERLLLGALVDEVVDLAVAVARDVGENAAARGQMGKS